MRLNTEKNSPRCDLEIEAHEMSAAGGSDEFGSIGVAVEAGDEGD